MAHQLSNPSGNPNCYLPLCTQGSFDDFLKVAGKQKQPGDVAGPRLISASCCFPAGPPDARPSLAR
jgi:hypothetical protein